jgi:hypothetical protein
VFNVISWLEVGDDKGDPLIREKKGKKGSARAAVGDGAGPAFGRCGPLRLARGWLAGPGQTLGSVGRISLFFPFYFLYLFLFFAFVLGVQK